MAGAAGITNISALSAVTLVNNCLDRSFHLARWPPKVRPLYDRFMDDDSLDLEIWLTGTLIFFSSSYSICPWETKRELPVPLHRTIQHRPEEDPHVGSSFSSNPCFDGTAANVLIQRYSSGWGDRVVIPLDSADPSVCVLDPKFGQKLSVPVLLSPPPLPLPLSKCAWWHDVSRKLLTEVVLDMLVVCLALIWPTRLTGH